MYACMYVRRYLSVCLSVVCLSACLPACLSVCLLYSLVCPHGSFVSFYLRVVASCSRTSSNSVPAKRLWKWSFKFKQKLLLWTGYISQAGSMAKRFVSTTHPVSWPKDQGRCKASHPHKDDWPVDQDPRVVGFHHTCITIPIRLASNYKPHLQPPTTHQGGKLRLF